MQGDYDMNETKIEEKYREFLDWLKKDIQKKDWEIGGVYFYPEKFKNILFTNKISQGQIGYPNINDDIHKYLIIRRINICNHSCQQSQYSIHPDYYKYNKKINQISEIESMIPKLEQKISSLEQSNQDILKKLEEQIQFNTILHDKLPKLEEQISEFKQTNEEILSKLQEQIILNEEFSKLNSKLCQRIFEMKEEKFKDEKS
jgi:hypothetical protein